jgi:hypothetical protein
MTLADKIVSCIKYVEHLASSIQTDLSTNSSAKARSLDKDLSLTLQTSYPSSSTTVSWKPIPTSLSASARTNPWKEALQSRKVTEQHLLNNAGRIMCSAPQRTLTSKESQRHCLRRAGQVHKRGRSRYSLQSASCPSNPRTRL